MGREGEWSALPGAQVYAAVPPMKPYQEMQHPPGNARGPPPQFARLPQIGGPLQGGSVAPPPQFSGAAQFSGAGGAQSSSGAGGSTFAAPPNAGPPGSGHNYGAATPQLGMAFRPPPASTMARGPPGPPPG